VKIKQGKSLMLHVQMERMTHPDCCAELDNDM
jgi:hypothetical protein